MNKPAKPEADDADDLSDIYGPMPTEAEWDAWIARNLDEINESLDQARQELAEGKSLPWNIGEILADCEAEFEKSQKG